MRYLEWEVRDMGISLKAMVEALDRTRLGRVRTNERNLDSRADFSR